MIKKLCFTSLLVFYSSITLALNNISISDINNTKIYNVKTSSIPSTDIAWLFPRIYTQNSCTADLFTLLHGKQINNLNEEQTANTLNDIGSEYSINFENDYVMLNLRYLNSEKDKSIKWFANAVYNSQFSDDMFNREKNTLIQNVIQNQKQPAFTALKNLYKNIYNTHPYAQTCSLNDAKSITLKDITNYYQQQFFNIENSQTKILMVGDINLTDINLTKQLLINSVKNNNNYSIPIVKEGNTNKQSIEFSDISQAHVNMGSLFIKRDNKDIFDILVANYILGGGGFSSRLMHEIREKNGFVYGISSTFLPLQQQGLFYIDFQTKVEQIDTVNKSVKDTLSKFIAAGVTEQEINEAKKFLLQSFSSRLDTNKKWLNQLAIIAWYNLPVDYLKNWQANVEKTNLKSVNACIKKYFDINKLHTSIVTKKP